MIIPPYRTKRERGRMPTLPDEYRMTDIQKVEHERRARHSDAITSFIHFRNATYFIVGALIGAVLCLY